MVDQGDPIGQGIVTTRWFSKDSFVCEYRGTLLDATVGRKEELARGPGMGYVTFFPYSEPEYTDKGVLTGYRDKPKW